MIRQFVGAMGLAAVLALLAPTSAVASGPWEMAVQHDLANGAFATAEWQTQSPARYSDTVITVATQRHGPASLEIFAERDVLGADGSVVSQTLLLADDASGFRFAIDRSGLQTARLSGRVPVIRCTYLTTGTCRPGFVSLSVIWSGTGPIARGAVAWGVDVEPMSGSLYLSKIVSSGSSRGALAAGWLGTRTLTAESGVAASLGTVHGGSIFVCLNDGCED